MGYNNFESYKEDYIKKVEKQNELLVDKHPYFFIYLYEDTRREYDKYIRTYNNKAMGQYNMSLKELRSLSKVNPEQKEFLDKYYEKVPVIDSKSVMNSICNHIESEVEKINEVYKLAQDDIWESYIDKDLDFDESLFSKIKRRLDDLLGRTDKKKKGVMELNTDKAKNKITKAVNNFEMSCMDLISNKQELANYMVRYFYEYKKSSSKKMLWDVFGEEIYNNVVKNKKSISIYVEDECGDIEYLAKRYRREIVSEPI